MIRQAIILIGVLGAVALAGPSPAGAEGGTSVAAAPFVPYGQLQTGNTATGGIFGNGGIVKSFWNLRVKAGDKVTIDWESPGGTHLEVFAVGTTDFTVAHANPSLDEGVGGSGRNELRFKARVTGTMPMAFDAQPVWAGPYAFTAYVKHWRPRHLHPHDR